MSESVLQPDLAAIVRSLQTRLAVVERRSAAASPAPSYTTTGRPAASAAKGRIIFNTTTLKHEGSDGTTWSPLY